ncbi:hypothetical protein ACJX0J_027352, partial [Zea mays]
EKKRGVERLIFSRRTLQIMHDTMLAKIFFKQMQDIYYSLHSFYLSCVFMQFFLNYFVMPIYYIITSLFFTIEIRSLPKV